LAAVGDGRQALVFLTERGRRAVDLIDKVWKRIEKDALAGIDDKDRKRLRKLLRQVAQNLGAAAREGDHAADEEEAAPDVAAT
ncbi:MAG: MarR family transcriptional regulator, partial [Rhizobiales bacterium]|nr:MarR family transcriptional regulator [Hyphomicrobiales bacterium]